MRIIERKPLKPLQQCFHFRNQRLVSAIQELSTQLQHDQGGPFVLTVEQLTVGTRSRPLQPGNEMISGSRSSAVDVRPQTGNLSQLGDQHLTDECLVGLLKPL